MARHSPTEGNPRPISAAALAEMLQSTSEKEVERWIAKLEPSESTARYALNSRKAALVFRRVGDIELSRSYDADASRALARLRHPPARASGESLGSKILGAVLSKTPTSLRSRLMR